MSVSPSMFRRAYSLTQLRCPGARLSVALSWRTRLGRSGPARRIGFPPSSVQAQHRHSIDLRAFGPLPRNVIRHSSRNASSGRSAWSFQETASRALVSHSANLRSVARQSNFSAECASHRSADHPRDDRYDEANSPEPEQVTDERPAACGEERVDASFHVRPLVEEGHY
jgi:hypothetical protein